MFTSTFNHGFQLNFENGYEVSVQWGHGNYCSNNDLSKGLTECLSEKNAIFRSETAEVAIFKNGSSITEEILGSCNYGWKTADEVADIILKVKNL